MNPKKTSELYLNVSKKLNVDSDEVQNVCSFFWKNLVNDLDNLSSTSIEIPILGQMRVKEKMLDKTLQSQTKKLNDIPFEKLHQRRYQEIQELCKNKIEKLKKLIELVESEKSRKLIKAKEKENYESNKNL